MTTLVITPNPATGSHLLTITPTATVTRIQRSDANGAYDVRVLTDQLPHLVATGVLVLDDYEAAQGTATYTVTTTADQTTGAAFLDLGTPWLGVPVTPQFSARVEAVTGYGAGGDSRSTVLEPIGAPFPVVIGRASSSRRGTLELWGGDYGEALDIYRLAMRGGVMFLRQAEHSGMDMFFTCTAAEIKTLAVNGAASRFGVSVRYIEVSRPGAPLSGALGWTWAELTNSYATWGDVFNAYATWGDVRTNKPL